MKKLFVLLSMLVVAMGVMVVPAVAAPTADLNALAQYFPADTPVFVSLRTDDAYITEIDDLFAKIAAQIPNMPKPDRIADQFDKAVGEVMGSGTFDSEVRSWLGDVASVGVMTFDGMMGSGSRGNTPPPHVLFAVEITDQKAASTFFETVLKKSPNADYEMTNEGGFTVFTSTTKKDSGIIAIGKDVLFVAVYKEDIPFDGQASPLSDNVVFSDSIGLLPEPDYNITMYFALGDLLNNLMATMSDQANMSASQAEMFKNMEPLFKNFPPEVIGFTVLDEHSLTIDVALPFGDLMKNYEASGLSTAMPVAVNPAFAANILSGSPLVIHSTNLGASLGGVLENIGAQAGMMGGSSGMSSEDIEKGVDQVKFFIQGLTGKDLEKDILPAMQGDYALYLALNPALTDVSSQADLMKQLPVDFGFLTEMTDPTIGAAIIDGINKVAGKSKDVKLTTETIGGVDALVITGTSAGMPFPVEMVLANNDSLLFFGTRRAAEAALTGTGGLDADASFIEAGQYIVASPSVIAYFASEGLKPLSKIIEMTGGAREGQQFDALLKLVSSASISSSYSDDIAYARLVWTMPQ